VSATESTTSTKENIAVLSPPIRLCNIPYSGLGHNERFNTVHHVCLISTDSHGKSESHQKNSIRPSACFRSIFRVAARRSFRYIDCTFELTVSFTQLREISVPASLLSAMLQYLIATEHESTSRPHKNCNPVQGNGHCPWTVRA
jgi:hypothetical protein